MAEMINEWDVVDKLIYLENEYNFHKWDAQTLYRKLCEVEVEIGKTSGVGWIPVTERLPETVDSYLVVVKAKYDHEDQYEIDTDVATYNPYEDGYIDGCWNTYNDWDEGQQYLHVTHWMPLPEPPKELDPAEGR